VQLPVARIDLETKVCYGGERECLLLANPRIFRFVQCLFCLGHVQQSGDTALTIAAGKDHDQMLKLLIEHGAAVNFQVRSCRLWNDDTGCGSGTELVKVARLHELLFGTLAAIGRLQRTVYRVTA